MLAHPERFGHPFTASGNLSSGQVTDEEKELEDERLREVEKSVQGTRERMLEGFGDIKATIEQTNTHVERTRADMIDRISGSESRTADRVNAAERDLSDKLHNTQKELGDKIGGRSWLIMGILLTAMLGGIGVATAILISTLQK